jgi:arylsulfatase A-like enzyme
LAQYYDEINRMDANTGRALKVLRTRGLYENTIVIFMGDNGASQFRGKGTLNELGLWVPLIIRMPGNKEAGTVVKALVSCEDILPTLLEVLRLDVPPELSGKSFAGALSGSDFKERKYVFAERMAHGELPVNSGAFDLGRVIIGKRYKFIYNCTWQLPYYPIDFGQAPFFKSLQRMHGKGELSALHARLYFGERSMFEMYDLEKDPLELNNLAGAKEMGKVEDELRRELSAQMIRNHDFLPPPIPGKTAR